MFKENISVQKQTNYDINPETITMSMGDDYMFAISI